MSPFVSEPHGTQIKADPARLTVFKDYVRNRHDRRVRTQPQCPSEPGRASRASAPRPATGRSPSWRRSSGESVPRQRWNSFTSRSLFVTSRAAVL
jgi:hypothetical protein